MCFKYSRALNFEFMRGSNNFAFFARERFKAINRGRGSFILKCFL